MPSEAEELLSTGGRALAAGDWPAARQAFSRAVELTEPDASGEALLGLADAVWWLGEVADSVAHRERAYAVLSRSGAYLPAALAAWQLSLDYWDSLSNTAAGHGWLARASRLVDDHGLAPMRGWILLLEAHYAADPRASEARAREALALGRAGADVDLQLCALSQVGAALVDQGQVVPGVRLLDEAMAGTLGGEASRPEPAVFASCLTLQACASCADIERAVQWLRAAERFMRQFGSPYLRADCRIHYGSMLIALGDWIQAEEELTAAVAASAPVPAQHREALATLATLRLAQGRQEEAGRLIAGQTGQPAAVAVIARLHLREGRADRARTELEHALSNLGTGRLQAVVLRELLGEALISLGDVAQAEAHGRALVELGAGHGCRVAAGYGARLCGRAAAAATVAPAGMDTAGMDTAGMAPAGMDTAGDGRARPARAHLEHALEVFSGLGMAYEAARTRVLLAGSLPEELLSAAIAHARTALADLDGLGARADADAAAALLRRLGGPAPRATVRQPGALTRREQEVLALLGEGLSNPEIAERLYLSRKTVEHHVARVLAKSGLRTRAEAVAEAAAAAVRAQATRGGPWPGRA